MKKVAIYFSLFGFFCMSVALVFYLYNGHGSIADDCNGIRGTHDGDYEVECLADDLVVKEVDDGFLANVQGHGRSSPGEVYYGKPGVYLDLLGHTIDTSCCYGNGLIVGDEKFEGLKKEYVMVIGNGSVKSRSGVFLMGHGYFDDFSVLDGGEACGSVDQIIQNNEIKFHNMFLSGSDGEVLADYSLIEGSLIRMMTIKIQGDNSSFINNRFIMEQDAGRLLESDHIRTISRFRSEYVGKYSLTEGLYSAGALYLSCADNATIINNIFTAKSKIPGAYAIVLKHSKNVRITNNTFEGFTVPVLMDKYSSIIDDSGNIIKPDVTANDPDSKLYGLDVDINKLIKAKTKPWWRFWE